MKACSPAEVVSEEGSASVLKVKQLSQAILCLLHTSCFFDCLSYFSALKTEAKLFSEVLNRITWYHILEYSHRCENSNSNNEV
jgi:hypothetical protein